MQETKLNNEENNLSSNVRCTSNKSNQNQNSESKLNKLHNKLTTPESNMLNLLPEQANQSPTKETRISTEQPEIEYSKYTLREKSKKCVLAGLSCELINSMLIFKCSVSNCLENQFSTVFLNDFSKHINKNHQFVIWDGNCEACHHNVKMVSRQYFVRNALEHLVSHHLVLKNNEKHLNTIGSKTEDSLCQVKKSQRGEYSLRVRYLPGDRLSIHKPTSLGISNLHDKAHVYTAHNSLSNDTYVNSINKSGNLNNNHGSNGKRFPLLRSLLSLSSRNSDAKSFKKGKVNTSKINSSASDNDDLNTWMKAKTNCEVVLPNSDLLLEAGQQIVNYDVIIHDSIYRLIDTAYTKDYIRKVRDFPMKVLKTQLAFNKMSALPGLLSLFKCMDRSCTKMFNSKELFKSHMQLHYSKYAEKKKKNQIYNVQQFKMCAYCFKAFDNEESLANHIAEKYTFCEYFCPYCFYRAYTASHVLVHQSVIHANINNNLIIKLDGRTCENPKEMLLVVDFKKFVLPYKCNIGCCGFSCYLHNEFLEHLNQVHQQCDRLYCYICANNNKDEGVGFFALNKTSMIKHFKLHHLNKYQCIFCLFGSETIDSMIKHLAFEHFEYEPLCLERSTVSDNCESKNIRNLKILRLKKVIENEMVKNVPVETICIPELFPRRSKKKTIESPDNPSLVIIKEKIERDELDNKKKKTNVSSNDDVIIDDEDNVVLSEKLELNENPKKQICLEIDESINGPNKAKRSVFPIIELDKLFVCKECDKDFSNGDLYLTHLKVCPYFKNGTRRTCTFCTKMYTYKLNMAEHIKLHGPDRFKCYLCDLKVPSERAIKLHMKNSHRIMNTSFVPEHLNLTDLSKDNFIVIERKTVMQKRTQEQPNYTNNSVNSLVTQQNTRLKRKHCSTIERDELDNKKKKTNVSSNDDVIIDDEDNVVLSEKLELNENPKKQICLEIDESINGPNKAKRSVFPIIELDKLFVCKECDKDFSNGDLYLTHLKVCPYFKNGTRRTCTFCTKMYTYKLNMAEHIKLHGPDRFKCYLCDLKVPSERAIKLHMKNSHRIMNTSFVPEHLNLTDLSKDNFIVIEHKTVMQKRTQEQPNYTNNSVNSLVTQQNTRLKRKHCSTIERDELDKKNIEVTLDVNKNTEIYPQFIQQNMRYKCWIPLCTFKGKTYDMLKKHIEILHPTYQYYKCPHCLPQCIISKAVEQSQIGFHLMHHGSNLYRCQYCDYIDFNQVNMRTHMRNTHLLEITSSVQSNIIVIRQTMLEVDSIDRGRSKAPFNVPQWICNICSNGLRYTKNEIISHVVVAHKVSNMFKCPMCQFEHKNDNVKIFEEHYKLQHPSVAVKCLRVFEKITDNENLHKQSKHLGGRAKRVRSFESSKTIIFNDKRTSSLPTKEKNTTRETKVLVHQPAPDTVSNIIKLVDEE